MPNSLSTINNICLLDDILRIKYIRAGGFIYTAIEEPIKQAINVIYPNTNYFPEHRGLANDFNDDYFRELCFPFDWVSAHHKLPKRAEDYLLSAIPANSLIISYESPPWLEHILEKNSIPFLSMRISPFRFARDLYVCFSSNIPEIHERLEPYKVDIGEYRIEAGLLRASAQQKTKKLSIEKIDNGFLFLGQTKYDASIISPDGKFLSITDFSQQIKDIVGSGQVGYKPHPYDKKFAKEELNKLSKILGRKVILITDNIYEILTSKINIELIAISSGACQEAAFFNKKAYILHNSICDPYSDKKTISSYRFIDILSSNFWRLIFDKELEPSKRPIQESENIMRRFHDVWWGYSEYHINNDKFWIQILIFSIKKYLISKRIFSNIKKIFK